MPVSASSLPTKVCMDPLPVRESAPAYVPVLDLTVCIILYNISYIATEIFIDGLIAVLTSFMVKKNFKSSEITKILKYVLCSLHLCRYVFGNVPVPVILYFITDTGTISYLIQSMSISYFIYGLLAWTWLCVKKNLTNLGPTLITKYFLRPIYRGQTHFILLIIITLVITIVPVPVILYFNTDTGTISYIIKNMSTLYFINGFLARIGLCGKKKFISLDPTLITKYFLRPVYRCRRQIILFKLLHSFFSCLVMDIEYGPEVMERPSSLPEPSAAGTAAAAAAAAAAATLSNGIEARDRSCTLPTNPAVPSTSKVMPFSPSNLFLQCSNAKLSEKKIPINTVISSESGPIFNVSPTPFPRVGNLYREGETELEKTFHGARLMTGGKTTNEVLSSSFDPATYNCLSCSHSHSILIKALPVAICFTDQNFVPHFSNNSDSNNSCVAVVRLEDASLEALAALAAEILDKHSLHPGSTILLGSATHLFRTGASGYASDWIKITTILEHKFRNVNICPLVPILRDTIPGSLARDLEILGTWFNKVYSNSIKGLLDSWNATIHFVQLASVGATPLLYPDIVKIPLPADLKSPAATIHFFQFSSSCPAHIQPMDRKVTTELVRILITALQKNFSISIGSEVILPRATSVSADPKDIQHIVCIGSSIVKQLIPFLQAQGYRVTDLSRPGWLATDENIKTLIESMSELNIEPGIGIVLDLFGNCSFRYENFDGTQSLPFKEGGKFHMAGPVVACNDDIFRRITRSLAPVLLSAQKEIKIIIPPLPRYIFDSCCGNTTHCSNIHNEGHAEKILSGTARLRNILKKEMAGMGVRGHWILDSVGSLLGTEPGKSSGSVRDVVPELRPALAKDGVHLTMLGNKNVAGSIISSLRKMQAGSLKSDNTMDNLVSGPSTLVAKHKEFYWRGFISHIGDIAGRAKQPVSCAPSRRERGRSHTGFKPYNRN
jgi:hypothetical protein